MHNKKSVNVELHRYLRVIESECAGLPPAMARRRFLQAGLALAAAGIGAHLQPAHAQAGSMRFTQYPFTLGVASGSPRATSVVLWTRLAPEPLAADGGMPPERVIVNWEVAEDEHFKRIVRKGVFRAVPELAHSVHAEVTGLAPGRWYWYRFMAGNETSPAGRTKTAPETAEKLRFAFASCQQFEQGYFSAYRHMLKEDVDLVAFLGDYIYEANWGSNLVRRHAGPEAETLAQYRIRHAQYKTDADLAAMHAAVPWVVTWDDHEVDNDYAADQSEHMDPRILLRRAAAYQAYYEHMPLPPGALPRGPDMRLYDRFSFGALLDMHVLDDRQYRSPQVCPRPGMLAGSAFQENCSERLDPSRTMLGAVQERWLFDGLANSRARWNILAQQTLMAQWDNKPGTGEVFWTDGWDGYAASRQKLLRHIGDRNINNAIVIGGDVHTHHVADLKLDFADSKSRTVATEFCGTSITSESSPQDQLDAMRPDNPHMLLADGRKRGYVVMDLAPQTATATLRVIDSEKKRDTGVSTLARFVVDSAKPGAQRA